MGLRQHIGKIAAVALGVPVVWLLASLWKMGGRQCAPRPETVGALPEGVEGEEIEFRGASGVVKGWLLPGKTGKGAVILAHQIRGNRLSMLGRAQFLNAAGYAVLLFDFQAHGESEGDKITFGHLESEDLRAGIKWLQGRIPGKKVVVLGASLGGAAALLASPPLDVAGLILEMVYPTIEDAVANRLAIKFGRPGKYLYPLLTWQLKPRTGVSAQELRPIERVGGIGVPKLFIVGTEDRHTPLAESLALYEKAHTPKEFWAMEGAVHENLHAYSEAQYEGRVLEFLRGVLG